MRGFSDSDDCLSLSECGVGWLRCLIPFLILSPAGCFRPRFDRLVEGLLSL